MSDWDPVSLTALVWAKQVLADHGITSAPPRDRWQFATADDPRAREALSRHRLIAAVAAGISPETAAMAPSSLRSWWSTQRRTDQRQVVAHVALAARLHRHLDGAGIRALFIKGPFQAMQATGQSAARGAGDLDLIVSAADFDRALALLITAGAEPQEEPLAGPLQAKLESVHHAATLRWSGVLIDLHRRLDPAPHLMRVPFDDLWQRRNLVRLAGYDFPTLDALDTCVLAASHGCRDNWSQLRQVVDFVQLLSRVTETAPMQAVADRAQEHGVTRRLAVALAVSRILVPELPLQGVAASQLARWTWARYRTGRITIGSGSPRDSVGTFVYWTATQGQAADWTYAARRLVWFTSATTEPVVPGQPLWAYPALAPLSVSRRIVSRARADRTPTPQPDERVWALMAAAIGGNATETPADAWRQWRQQVDDFDNVTAAEISLLPLAWAHASAHGATDPAAGRLRGLQRRAAVHSATVLAAAARTQSELASRGVVSVLTGPAAAALGYPNLNRWPLLRAELWIDTADVDTALAPGRMSWARRIVGRAPIGGDQTPEVAVTWRLPDRSLRTRSLPDGHQIHWRGRTLHVAAPHFVAYHCLVQGLLAARPGAGTAALAMLDLHLLAGQSDFDDGAFAALVRSGGWGPLFAAHGGALSDVLPQRLLELLGVVASDRVVDLRESARWGRVQAAATPRAVRWGARVLT